MFRTLILMSDILIQDSYTKRTQKKPATISWAGLIPSRFLFNLFLQVNFNTFFVVELIL